MEGAKHRGQYGVMGGIKPRQRNGQVKAQSQVRQLRRIGRRSKVCGFQTTLENLKAKFLVIATHPGVQDSRIFQRWSFDCLKAVALIGLTDDRQHGVSALFLAGREITHAACGSDSHTAILP